MPLVSGKIFTMIKSYYFILSLFFVVMASLVSVVSLANTTANSLQPAMQKPISESVFSPKNSAYFEENKGQFDRAAHYVSRVAGYQLYLTDGAALVVLEAKAKSAGESSNNKAASVELRHRLLGATGISSPEAIDQLLGRSHYFVGQRKDWRSDVRHYRAVQYAQVYPGIDMVYYSRGSALEYDFVVASGASPQLIRYTIDGAEDILIDASGNLVVKTAYGDLLHHAPYSYQDINGQRLEVASQFNLDEKNVVSFEVAAYDSRHPLIIDPVLSYSGYLGGAGDDVAYDVAADAQGNFYVTGQTQSSDFPGAGGFAGFQGGHDAFVSKFSKEGVLLFTSYIGTENTFYSENEVGRAIAVDSLGKVYVTGAIAHNLGAVYEKIPSDPFSAPPLQAYDDCDNGVFDVFIAVLSSDLNLDYLTCVGGSAGEMGEDIAVDASGDIYVTGWTASTQFPTKNAFQPNDLGARDAFVLKLSPDAQGEDDLMFSSYLGGETNLVDSDEGFSIALDAANNIYVAGDTASSDLLAPKGALSPPSDGFIAKINAANYSLAYTRYLGVKNARGIVSDSGGDLYVTGQSQDGHAYVAKLDGTTGALVSDYAENPMLIGGEAGATTEGAALAVDSTDSVYLVGTTQAMDLMGQDVVAGNAYSSGSDAFLARLDSQGGVRYSVYLGGSDNDRGNGVAHDELGNVYVVGETASVDYPVYQAQLAQSANSGGVDAFLARIGPYNDMSVSIVDDGPVAVDDILTYTLTVSNFGPDAASGIRLVDTLPSGVVFQGYQFQAGQGACSEVLGVVDCVLNNMVSGQAVILDVLVKVNVATVLSSEVVVSADQFDFLLSNNSTSVDTEPASSAPLFTVNDTGEESVGVASSSVSQTEGGGALGGLLFLLLFCRVRHQNASYNCFSFNK